MQFTIAFSLKQNALRDNQNYQPSILCKEIYALNHLIFKND